MQVITPPERGQPAYTRTMTLRPDKIVELLTRGRTLERLAWAFAVREAI